MHRGGMHRGGMNHGYMQHPHMQQQPHYPQQQQPMPVQQQPMPIQEQKFEMNEMSGLNDEEKKQQLGEVIYNKIEPLCGEDQAARITGMLLDLEIGEIIQIANDDAYFHQRYIEAR